MADDRLIDLVAPDVRTVERVPWPGADQREVGLLLLRTKEIEDAQVDARLHIKRRGLNPSAPENEELLSRAEDLELMFRMVVHPDSQGQPDQRLFKDRDEVARRTDPFQRAAMLDWHIHHQNRVAAKYVYPGDDAEQAKE